MANLKEVRLRIASVSSTQQITSAMKMVSAAKFRRAQNAIIGMRPYSAQLTSILADIGSGESVLTPYHQQRKENSVLLIVVTSNKGLCGAFNSNIIKQTQARIKHYQELNIANLQMATIGKRASEFFAKHFDHLIASYDDMLDAPSFDAVATLADNIMQQYCQKQYDRVEIIYNRFKNSLMQIPTVEQFLPIAPDQERAGEGANNDYLFEPSREEILRQMVPLTLRSQFYRIVLDSLAAEHAARMNAMQKATDNASELLKELKLSYNKARQAAITNEIIEIVSGSEALKG
ncbi:MAG: ATP synthase F1 subunit gamma [Bacteroidales bacterium]|nr:ATP synthase F1 subunit gamma [Bacteroidales bacterium]